MQVVRQLSVVLAVFVCLNSLASMVFLGLVVPGEVSGERRGNVDWFWFAGHAAVGIVAFLALGYLLGWWPFRRHRASGGS